MQRRELLQLLAAAATGVWAKQQLQASALLEAAASAGGAAKATSRIAPVAQERPLPEPLLPLFPLQLVLFPRANLPLHIFEERYKEMIQDCLENHGEFGILLVQDRSVASIGCTASIAQVLQRFPDGRMNILVRGRRRFEISSPNQEKSYLRGTPQFFEDDEPEPPAGPLRQQALQLLSRLLALLESEDRSRKEPAPVFSDQQLSFQIASELPPDLLWKQNLLEMRSERERLIRVMRYLRQLIDHLEQAPEQRPPAGTAVPAAEAEMDPNVPKAPHYIKLTAMTMVARACP